CHTVRKQAAGAAARGRKHSPPGDAARRLIAMDYLRIAVLALIQGAAELLPVSSSAHVIVAEKLMGMDPSTPEMTFLLIMLHTGTMFAVLAYFWPRWKELLWPPVGDAANGPRRFSWRFMKNVMIATATAGLLGLGIVLLIEKVLLPRWLGQEASEVEHLFKNLALMAAGLATVGVFILVSGSLKWREDPAAFNARSSAVIGIVQ